MNRAISLLLALGLLATQASFGQGPVTGTPPFGSFGGGPFDTVNLGNLNVHFAIPVVHKAGRGMPFTYDLSYDSSIWSPIDSSGNKAWTPVPNWGWRGVTEVATGYVGVQTTLGSSNGCAKFTYTFVYHDTVGVSHAFYPSIASYSGKGCPQNQFPITLPAFDSSGYRLIITGLGDAPTGTLTSRSGKVITPPFNTGDGAGTATDANGNEITVNGSGQFFDTLSSTTPVLTVAGTAPNPTTYTYTAPAGPAHYTMNYSSYPVSTAFHCTGIAEYSASVSLVSSIVLPDNSQYTFNYEKNSAGNYTGRLASVALPTGGTITYTCSGGTNGINCADGTAMTVTRAVSPGGTWTYTRTQVSGNHWTTNITSPPDPQNTNSANDVTLIDFQRDSSTLNPTGNFYETQRKVNQGSSGLLMTRLTCYNGNYASCTTTSVATPILQRDVYTTLPNSATSLSEMVYDSGGHGLLTTNSEYDYGVNTGSAPTTSPVRTTSITYDQTLTNAGILDRPSLVNVFSGSTTGTLLAHTNYKYDETAVTGTTSTPQLCIFGNPGCPAVGSRRGNLTSVIAQANSATNLYRNFTYFDTGTMKTSTDVSTSSTTAGPLTTYTYGDCGNSFLTNIAEPLSLSRSMTWDCSGGVPLTATDENQQKTTYTYNDPLWRMTKVTRPDGGSTTTTYDSPTVFGVFTTTDSSGVGTQRTVSLDGLGRPIHEYDSDPNYSADQHIIDTTYNAFGQVAFVTNPYFTTSDATYGLTQYQYDALGRLTFVQFPSSRQKSISYNGRAMQVDLYPASSHFTKIYQMDGLGRTTSICEVTSANQADGSQPTSCGLDITGTGFLATASYDALNNLTGLNYGVAWQARIFKYDGLSRLVYAQYPEVFPVSTTYTYDTQSAGDLYQRIAPAPNQTGSATVTTTFTHDALHRLTQVGYSDGSTPSSYFTYDQSAGWNKTLTNGKGRLSWSGVVSGNNDTIYGYDSMGRVSLFGQCTPQGCQNGTGFIANYSYNYLGEPLNGSDIQGGVVWNNTYNANGQLTQVQSNLNPPTLSNLVSGIAYNALGEPVSDTLGNGVAEAWTYNVDGMPATYSAGSAYNYGLSWLGAALTSANDSVNGNWTYTYDDFERLATAGTSVNAFSYSYDRWGNRWNQTVTKGSGPQPSYSFAQTGAAAGQNNNRIVGSGISYDSAGNVTGDGSHTYTYDAENRLLKVDGGSTATYGYNSRGQRVTYNVGSRLSENLFDLAGHQVANIPPGTTNVFYSDRFIGGRHWDTEGGGTTHFIHADWLGTGRAWTNLSGALEQTCTNLPFGDAQQCTNTLASPAHFTGQPHDSEDNLDHFQFRQYSNTPGRWLTPDPAGVAVMDVSNPQTWNRYAYVANNPLSYTDPAGLNRQFPGGGCDSDHYDCGSSGGSPSDPGAGGATDFSAIGNSSSDCPICSGPYGSFGTAGLSDGFGVVTYNSYYFAYGGDGPASLAGFGSQNNFTSTGAPPNPLYFQFPTMADLLFFSDPGPPILRRGPPPDPSMPTIGAYHPPVATVSAVRPHVPGARPGAIECITNPGDSLEAVAPNANEPGADPEFPSLIYANRSGRQQLNPGGDAVGAGVAVIVDYILAAGACLMGR